MPTDSENEKKIEGMCACWYVCLAEVTRRRIYTHSVDPFGKI